MKLFICLFLLCATPALAEDNFNSDKACQTEQDCEGAPCAFEDEQATAPAEHGVCRKGQPGAYGCFIPFEKDKAPKGLPVLCAH